MTTKLTFDFNWKLTLCVLFVFPALIRLSFWQVERADEKKILRQQWETRQAAAAQPFAQGATYADYDRVSLKGRFISDKYWLKENQMYRGQLGYSVLMPFQLESGFHVLVDRGWVRGSVHREFVPTIDTPSGERVIEGTVMTPSDLTLVEEPRVEVMHWPHKILETNLDIIAEQSDVTFYEKMVRIDAHDPAALVMIWQPLNSSAAKHYGYAVQWALMAVVLIVLYMFASSNLSAWLKARMK